MLALLLLSSVSPAPDVSFAFFGCNRMDAKDWKPIAKESPSSANVAQLNQNFDDIAGLPTVPKYFFALGDLVNNYAEDQGETLNSQLEGWWDLWRASKLNGKTSLLVVPGNHELNRKKGDQRLPNLATDKVWNDWMSRHALDKEAGNGPTATGDNPDKLVDDQSRLNFSYTTSEGIHFIVLNTDTRTSEIDEPTKETKIGWVPYRWVQTDLDAAEKDPSVRAVFLMGHRNLVAPDNTKGDAPIISECADPLLASVRSHSKVRAYLCAHVHANEVKNLGGDSKAWQLIAGNGGSPLEKGWKPTGGTFFGFMVVHVAADGTVTLDNYKRPTPPEPQKYFEVSPAKPDVAKTEGAITLWSPKTHAGSG